MLDLTADLTGDLRTELFSRFASAGRAEHFGTTLTGARVEPDDQAGGWVWAAWNNSLVHGGGAHTRLDALAAIEEHLGAWGVA